MFSVSSGYLHDSKFFQTYNAERLSLMRGSWYDFECHGPAVSDSQELAVLYLKLSSYKFGLSSTSPMATKSLTCLLPHPLCEDVKLKTFLWYLFLSNIHYSLSNLRLYFSTFITFFQFIRVVVCSC